MAVSFDQRGQTRERAFGGRQMLKQSARTAGGHFQEHLSDSMHTAAHKGERFSLSALGYWRALFDLGSWHELVGVCECHPPLDHYSLRNPGKPSTHSQTRCPIS